MIFLEYFFDLFQETTSHLIPSKREHLQLDVLYDNIRDHKMPKKHMARRGLTTIYYKSKYMSILCVRIPKKHTEFLYQYMNYTNLNQHSKHDPCYYEILSEYT